MTRTVSKLGTVMSPAGVITFIGVAMLLVGVMRAATVVEAHRDHHERRHHAARGNEPFSSYRRLSGSACWTRARSVGTYTSTRHA